MRPLLFVATGGELAAALPHRAGCLPKEQQMVAVEIAGRPWWLCCSGVGPINAALAAGRALAQQAVSFVLQVGVAGAFDLDAMPLGSRVLVTEEIDPEYGYATEDGVDARALGFPQWRGGDTVIWDRLALGAVPEDLGLRTPARLLRGASLSVAGVSATPERAARLWRRYGAALENMEGFAVALACARYAVPFLELRTVSNKVGSRAPEDRDFPGALRELGVLVRELTGDEGQCRRETAL